MNNNISLSLGDSVIVKPNVQDPDLGRDIGGWQGRISDIDPDNDLICIDWDSLTLKNMPASIIAHCQVEGLDWGQMYLGSTEVELTTARDTPEDVAEMKAQLDRQHHLRAEKQESIPPLPDRAEVMAGTYALMLGEIRSWGLWLLAFGVIHLLASGFLNAPWGILLLVVGLTSFYFREAPMFIVYSLTLAWAALSNLTAGQGGWFIFALFQFYLAFQIFRKFFHFRQFQKESATLQAQELSSSPMMSERATQVFPWAGCILGALSLVGLVTLFVMVIVLAGAMEVTEMPGYLNLIEGLVVDLGVLGLAVGTASILSGYPYKVVAWLGTIASAMVLLLELTLVLFG